MFDKELKRLNDNIETTKVQAGIIRDRVAGHIRRNKGTYIGIVATAVISVGGTTLVARRPNVITQVDTMMQNTINGPAWKPTQTNNSMRVYYGDPGNHVQCIETGEIWMSQGAAARATGIHPSYLSNHLRGITPHCKSQHFQTVDPHGLDIVKPAV